MALLIWHLAFKMGDKEIKDDVVGKTDASFVFLCITDGENQG